MQYYTSGEFARMARVSIRTIRYYDKIDILNPTKVTETGNRLYTDRDLGKLQQIMLLKYLGFSLEEIKQMTLGEIDADFIKGALGVQLRLVQNRIEQMRLVEKAIQDTTDVLQRGEDIDWSRTLDLIHLTAMENSLKEQYQDASNITSRMNLHRNYSTNPQGWFPWIYEHCQIASGMSVIELGCGDGSLWAVERESTAQLTELVLNDISDGMLMDARRKLGKQQRNIQYRKFDCHKIPYPNQCFDLVVANHVLFYCENIDRVCKEVRRVLREDGRFICSTYGSEHMCEITDLIQEFDSRIVLSGERLYDKFGAENGREFLDRHFQQVTWHEYEDCLNVTEATPIISYILSCHGNQNQYLLERYNEFVEYVNRRVSGGFRISKKAGIFICR